MTVHRSRQMPCHAIWCAVPAELGTQRKRCRGRDTEQFSRVADGSLRVPVSPCATTPQLRPSRHPCRLPKAPRVRQSIPEIHGSFLGFVKPPGGSRLSWGSRGGSRSFPEHSLLYPEAAGVSGDPGRLSGDTVTRELPASPRT